MQRWGVKGEEENKVIGREQSQLINVGLKYTLVKQFSLLVKHLHFTWGQMQLTRLMCSLKMVLRSMHIPYC